MVAAAGFLLVQRCVPGVFQLDLREFRPESITQLPWLLFIKQNDLCLFSFAEKVYQANLLLSTVCLHGKTFTVGVKVLPRPWVH